MKKIEELKNEFRKIARYNHAIALIGWDLETGAPKKSVEKRAEVLGELSSYAFELSVSEKIGELIKETEKEELNEDDKALIRIVKKEYEKSKKIPSELMRKFSITTSNAQAAWEKAREEKDFNIFKPHLEKIVELTKKMADIVGYKENRYDALLDMYEPGLTVKDLNKTIKTLKDELISFVSKLLNEGKRPNDSFMKGHFDNKKQEDLSYIVLDKMGYDLEAGRMDVAVHPFTTTIGPNDVRITTRYREDDFRDSFYSTVHEGGHALYEQGISEKYSDLPIGEAASMAIHESQSRFWENIVGRSFSFWKNFYSEVQKEFEQFKNISVEDFYKAVNVVEKSLIRVDADEVTYNLHVMLRYEIEEALINDRIKVEDLPKIWNQKSKEYFGIEPKDDVEGVLQDVHWAHGSFGYFPSYMLGNLYSAQLYYKLKEEVDFEENLERGNLNEVLDWLRTNIHQYGSKYEPQDLIEKITGERLNPQFFMKYLKEKYSEIYEI